MQDRRKMQIAELSKALLKYIKKKKNMLVMIMNKITSIQEQTLIELDSIGYVSSICTTNPELLAY